MTRGGRGELMDLFVSPFGSDPVLLSSFSLGCHLLFSIRYAQDSIHTLFSRARFAIKEGDYSLAKETARRSLLQALVKTGDLPSDHVRRGSSSVSILSAAEEVSQLLPLLPARVS